MIDTNNIISSSLGAGLLSNVVLANTPQLFITFTYVFYNDMLTRMLMSHEYSQFARVRKTLRVSQPRGEQRSTYWLQLPYRYSIPLMLSMIVLHWLVSRSIFLVRITIYDDNGSPVPYRDINACGFSPLAILLAFCLSTLMIAVLVGLGRFRHTCAGIPAASSCSAAISAAVHPLDSEPDDAALLPLQYGVLPGTARHGAQYGRSTKIYDPGLSVRERVSFSSGRTTPLESGMVYR